MALRAVRKNKSLSDQAYDIIRNAIVFHDLNPSDTLTEERLSEQLSISRTPIRTALQRLVDEGLAEVRGKGIVVSNVSSTDIDNISQVRMSLELLVIEQLRGKDLAPLIAQLRETVICQRAASKDTAEDYAEYIRQDSLFHTTLARGTENKYLQDVTERINTHSTRCLILIYNLPQSRTKAIDEHVAVINALEQQDFDAARKAMGDHIENIVTRLKTRGSATPPSPI